MAELRARLGGGPHGEPVISADGEVWLQFRHAAAIRSERDLYQAGGGRRARTTS